jgi:hypothetical protein
MTMRVMVIFVVRMGSRHGVGGEGRQVVSAAVRRMAVVGVVTVRVGCSEGAFALDLGCGCGEEVDVEVLTVVGTPA